MEKKIDTRDLRPGMYVSSLDRPWVETPFLFQGFVLESAKDVAMLREHCRFVYIDAEKGEDGPDYLADYHGSAGVNELERMCHRPDGRDFYQDTCSVEEELLAARQQHRQAQQMLYSVLEDVEAGKPLSLAGVNDSVDGLIDSVLRNPDAFLWLTQLEAKDRYAYAHALNACTLSVAFGRHMGLPKEELRHIAVGTLLFDIGKMKVPQELLNKPGRLSDAEFELIKEHVAYGLKLVTSTNGFSRSSIDLLHTHHERFNGSGYPNGWAGTDIPVYGRMAAIVDCYAAITCRRPHRPALSPHEAIRKLFSWRGVDFQEELIEQFIQCLGVYPTGTMVELSTGEVAIIISQNRLRRLRPRIMMIMDMDKQRLPKTTSLDLRDQPELEILRAVEPGEYGLNPDDFYL